MAIDFSQVTAITIPEGSVSQITDSSSNIIWSTSSGPTKGRYYLRANIRVPNTSSAVANELYIIDTTTETLLYDSTSFTNFIQELAQGNYKINYSFITMAIQNIINQIGGNINNLKITNLYLNQTFNVKMYGSTTRYLKATNYNGDTLFTTTATGTSPWGTSYINIPWNDTNITSSYWDTDTGGIEDISCRDGYATTISNQYYTQIQSYTNSSHTTTSNNLRGIDYLVIQVFFQ